MMKRLSLILILLSLAVVQQVHAQYYSVNYDARTVAAMATGFRAGGGERNGYRFRYGSRGGKLLPGAGR